MCDSNSKGTCKCVSVSQQFFCVFRHDKFGMKHTLIIHFTFARRIPTNNTIPTYFIFKKKKMVPSLPLSGKREELICY